MLISRKFTQRIAFAMKKSYIALVTVTLSSIGFAFGYHHLAGKNQVNATRSQPDIAVPANNGIAKKAAHITKKATRMDNSSRAPQPDQNAVENHRSETISTRALTDFLDQVIADAIARGALDPKQLSAQQQALLPAKLRPRSNDEPVMTTDEIARIEEQIALGDDAPPPPTPQEPCPDPNKLPENYNNDYNKMILRQRGCKL